MLCWPLGTPRSRFAGRRAGSGQGVAHPMHAAPLPGGPENLGDGVLEAVMGIGDHQLHRLQAAADEGLEKAGPEGLCLRGPDLQPDDLTASVGADGDGDYGCHGHDPAALALLEVSRVQPEIGPFALQWPVEEGADALIDVFAELGNLRLADPGQSHGLDEVVHSAGRDALDPPVKPEDRFRPPG